MRHINKINFNLNLNKQIFEDNILRKFSTLLTLLALEGVLTILKLRFINSV